MKNMEYLQMKSAEENFRITFFIPFFVDLRYDLESRFNDDLTSVYDLDMVL